MKDSPAGSASAPRESRLLPWIALTAILIGYFALVVHLHPRNFFGLTQDDTLYFSSARAIAEGHGYVMPSVPGTPPATKYPILYPWILSCVWRWDPSFPGNLSLALAVNLVFGAAYLGIAFVFFRRLPRFSDTLALVLTAVCAVNPSVLFLSANLMSDIPFATFALAACIAAAREGQKESGTRLTLVCGILSGISILIRAMGVPIAMGLFVSIALRTGWRKATVFAACVAPFGVALFWRSMLLSAKALPTAASSCAPSWRMTWLYYTSYAGFWRADVLSHGVFWQTVASNLRSILLQPGAYFLKGTFIRPAVLALALLIALAAVAIRGVVRLAGFAGWLPIHWALGFSVLPVLAWDYAIMDRFLIPFLPLLCAAIWVEVRQIVSLVRQAPGPGDRAGQRIAAGFFYLVGAALVLGIGVSWRGEINALAKLSESRATLHQEKHDAYDWLKANTSPDSKILAYEDASAFLYSGRQGLRPVIFSASGVYRPDVLNLELECIASTAEPLGANYWVVSDDDFGYEWEPASSRAREKERDMERTLHPLFRSKRGGVRIYQLNSGSQPQI
jgi:4-amino-4-deoxy-L-arabinose transferase-like glycosyltransferase